MGVGLSLSGAPDVGHAAQVAETAGLDYVACGEHVLFESATRNALVTLAYVAGLTSTCKLLTAVTIAPLYPSALLAKAAATAHELSGGRLILGLGLGGDVPEEFAACGVPLADRRARLVEALDVLPALFERESVIYEGRWTRLQGAGLVPVPVPHTGAKLPIWLAGRSGAARRRACRRASGWIPYLMSPSRLGREIESMKEDLESAQRDRSDVRVAPLVFVTIGSDRAAAETIVLGELRQHYGEDAAARALRSVIAGSPQECAELLQGYIASGADDLIIALRSGPEDYAEMLEVLTERVIPALEWQ